MTSTSLVQHFAGMWPARLSAEPRLQLNEPAPVFDAICLHLQHQRTYRSDRFRQALETQLGRSVGPQKISRPKKIEVDQRPSSAQTRLSLGEP